MPSVAFDMNDPTPASPATFTIALTGQITLSADDVRRILAEVVSPNTARQPAPNKIQEPPLRLAFTMKETAAILGVSYLTVHRLLQRGLLRSSRALRTKIIARSEIERFLKDSSRLW